MPSAHIGLIDPKSPQNMGSILRAAGCYQVSSIHYTGSRYARASEYITDTKKRHLDIKPTQVDDLLTVAKQLQLTTVGIELVEGASPLPQFSHPDQAMYIFGPEDGSLPQAVVDGCDQVVYIPTIGCMNLAATVNVVLYDRLVKRPQLSFNNELIKASRDTNNRTKVKPR